MSVKLPSAYVGIDNNASGAIACIRSESGGIDEYWVKPMPVLVYNKIPYIDERGVSEQLLKIAGTHDPVLLGFEMGNKQPLFGAKGNFSNGFSYGVIRTVVRMLNIPHEELKAKNWQDRVLRNIRGTTPDTKEASIEFCRRMFPAASLFRTPRSKKPDHNLSDALCIAYYMYMISNREK